MYNKTMQFLWKYPVNLNLVFPIKRLRNFRIFCADPSEWRVRGGEFLNARIH